MDKLSKYTQQHRDAFNAFELPQGFEHRFEQKLGRKRRRRTLHFITVVAAVAASISLLVWLQPNIQPPLPHTKPTAEELAFADVSLYYTQQMDLLMAQISEETAQRSPGTECLLCAEAQRLYDEKNNFEQSEMTLLVPDEQSLGVLYTFYTTKLSNLELLLSLAKQN